MTNSISYPDWVEIIKTEYLDSFIREGGSSIKFAVPVEDGIRPSLFRDVRRVAEDLDYLVAEVNSN